MRKLIVGLVLSLGLVGTAVAEYPAMAAYPHLDHQVLMKLYINSEREIIDGDQVIVLKNKAFEELQLTEKELVQYIPALTEIYNDE